MQLKIANSLNMVVVVNMKSRATNHTLPPTIKRILKRTRVNFKGFTCCQCYFSIDLVFTYWIIFGLYFFSFISAICELIIISLVKTRAEDALRLFKPFENFLLRSLMTAFGALDFLIC